MTETPTVNRILGALGEIVDGGPTQLPHAYSTTAFTSSLRTGSGGWIHTLVQTNGLHRALDLIGADLHRKFPLLFTNPKDWRHGSVACNQGAQTNFPTMYGRVPEALTLDEVIYTTPFQWREDSHDHQDGMRPRPNMAGHSPGEVPPPPDQTEPNVWKYDNHSNSFWSARDQRVIDTTQRCPRCGHEDLYVHGALHQHQGHNILALGAFIQITDLD